MSSQIVENFINHYEREQFYYESLSSRCGILCRKILESEGIKSIVTYRAKGISELRDKLIKRDREKNYNSAEAIRNDIIDLAGVRVLLFFPNDLTDVIRILSDNFGIENAIEHSGEYKAKHLHIKMNGLEEGILYNNDIIEIQISSILLNAWSEIEHDIQYKPRGLSPSRELQDLLRKLNVTVLEGELLANSIYKGFRQLTTFPRPNLSKIKLKITPGSLIRDSNDRWYYWYGLDSGRYVFPNEETLKTWFPGGISKICHQIPDEQLSLLPLRGNVTYKPGKRLIKIKTDPSIYAVARGGVLRKMMDHNVILDIYGKDWNNLVDEMPDAWFVNYSIGSLISNKNDYNPKKEENSVSEKDIGIFI